jgi:hypothetical protein
MPKPAPSLTAFLALAALIIGAALAAMRERPRLQTRSPKPERLRVLPAGKQVAGTITDAPKPDPASRAILVGLAANLAPPVRSPPDGVPPVLRDLLARVPRPDYWRDPIDPSCPVTWAHEATHGMTAELSRGGGRWVMYLLDGRAVVFKSQPAVTIGQVAATVPAHQRGPIFDLYLVKQRKDWDREPLYLLDEWNCYVHGTVARRQAGLKTRKETEQYAAEMERYCRAMLALVEDREPDYPDMSVLRSFIEWQSSRFDDLTGVLP